MKETCFLCRRAAPDGACYVRVGTKERSSCRSCWEQVVLNPGGFLQRMWENNVPLKSLLGTTAAL